MILKAGMGGFAGRFKVVPFAAKVALCLLPFLDEQLQTMGKPRGPRKEGTMFSGGNVTVYVSNMDRAVRFYSETLGLKLAYRFGDHWASIEAGTGLTIGPPGLFRKSGWAKRVHGHRATAKRFHPRRRQRAESQGCSFPGRRRQRRQGRFFHRLRRSGWQPALSRRAQLEPRRKGRGPVSACESLKRRTSGEITLGLGEVCPPPALTDRLQRFGEGSAPPSANSVSKQVRDVPTHKTTHQPSSTLRIQSL